MALSSPSLSNATTTSVDCSIDTDVSTGTIYYLVTTGSAASIEPSACVNFGQSITGFGTGTIDLGTWTSGVYPASTSPDGLYNKTYRLHVVQDELDDGSLTPKSVSDFLPTLNDNEMFPPADTVRYTQNGTISRDDPLIQDWIRSGANVNSDDSTTALPANISPGEYTVTFSNPLSTIPNQARTLRIAQAIPSRDVLPQFASKVITDGSDLNDASEFWGLYKYGDYLFCAKGAMGTIDQQGGVRVYDVSDVANGNAPLVFNDAPQNDTGTGYAGSNRFLRTVQVKGTPGTAGAEMYVIYRSSPYTASGQSSMIYAYDISDANPAGWVLRSPWGTSSDFNGGDSAPAYSVEMLSDMTYDGANLYCSTQKSGLKKYDPADLSSPVAVNQNYTPRQHETQGSTVDSDPNGYMYVAAYQNGIRIVNKADLSDNRFSILFVIRLQDNTAMRPWDAALSEDENWLFVSLQSADPIGTPTSSGLAVYDVHDPEKPQLVTYDILPVSDQDVFNGRHDQACIRINRFKSGGRQFAILGNLKKGHAIWDVTDPTRPDYRGTLTASLQQAGTQIDGVGHSAVWEDGGVTYIAYGDYGSTVGAAGTKQLYIDQFTLEDTMAFSIGNAAAPNGVGGAFINQSNGRGPDASYDYTSTSGDYVDRFRAAVDAQPAPRTVKIGLYRKDNGLQFHEEDLVIDPGGYPFTGEVIVPLAGQVALPGGVDVTFRATHVAGGTNLIIDNYNGTSGHGMRQVINPSDSVLPIDLATDADYGADDGIIALLGDNSSTGDGKNAQTGGVGDNTTTDARDNSGDISITGIGGVTSSIIGVSTNQDSAEVIFSETQTTNHTFAYIGGGGTDSDGQPNPAIEHEAEVFTDGAYNGKAVRHVIADVDAAPDAAVSPSTYLNKTDPAETVEDGNHVFAEEP